MNQEKGEFRLSPSLLGILMVALGIALAIQLSGSEKAGAHTVRATLVAGNSGKCLAVHPSHFFNGALPYQWTCGGNNNVEIEDAGGGWHYIRFTHSNKCLTVHGYAWWDGATLDQWDCVGQSNQRWSGNFSGGVFEVHYSQANPTKCITVHQESPLNGAIINQWHCFYQSNQAWLIVGRDPMPTPTPTRTRTPTPTPTPVPGDGELTIAKICDPVDDEGEFVIRLQGVIQGTIGCGESIGPLTLAAGTYTVTESGATGTDIDDYDIDFNEDCDDDGEVVIEADEEMTCEIVNTLAD